MVCDLKFRCIGSLPNVMILSNWLPPFVGSYVWMICFLKMRIHVYRDDLYARNQSICGAFAARVCPSFVYITFPLQNIYVDVHVVVVSNSNISCFKFHWKLQALWILVVFKSRLILRFLLNTFKC